MAESPRIVVIGATGYTGRLVARELAAHSAPCVLTGRTPPKLERLAAELGGADTALADVRQPASLARVVQHGDVVINCAGPFTDLGEPVVRACIEQGAHYLDTTGEQLFMKRVLDAYQDPARRAAVVVVNGMAFEYALGDCGAAIAAEELVAPLQSLDVVYAWRAGMGTASRGTRRSILRILGARGYSYRAGAWRREAVAAARRRVRLPGGRTAHAVSFPAGEALTVPRHVRVQNVRGWIVLGRGRALVLPFIAPALPFLTRLAAPLVELLLRRAPEGPADATRRASQFLILVQARRPKAQPRRVVIRGRDPYALTAAIVVNGAMRLLAPPPAGAPRPGVLAPAQLVEPRSFLDQLRPRGLEWQIEA